MNLLELPDELILYILNKINVVDALFQLNHIDEQLDKYLFDSLYVCELDFTVKTWNDKIFPKDQLIIDQVSTTILPRINEKITKLTIEPQAIDRVLNAVNYPNLVSLSLRNFSKKILCQHLTENRALIELLRNQILHLHVEIIEEKNIETVNSDDHVNVFQLILSSSQRLTEFTFHRSLSKNVPPSIHDLLFTDSIGSTLTKLDLRLGTFDECQPIFDGHFQSLSHCSLFIFKIFSTQSIRPNKDQLLRLRFFSLISCTTTPYYDELIVPLVEKMLNIVELRLSLLVRRNDLNHIVDGNDLVNRILIHLQHLQIFHFSIYNDFIETEKLTDEFTRNDNRQRLILEKWCGKIGSYMHFNWEDEISGYHIYSIPYVFKELVRLSHSFSSEIFINVRVLAVNDRDPWDFQFLDKINKSFPHLECLMIFNSSKQKNKPLLNNLDEEYSCITFARLRSLFVKSAHLDYIEQFLDHRCTRLPQLCELTIKYQQLISITNNFTNDRTRLHCSQVENLMIDEHVAVPEHFASYFSSLKSLTSDRKT